MNTCDIIIPAYNNQATLKRTVAALREQNIPANWKMGIIVVDDGSTPPVKLQITNYKLQITVLRQPHAGSAQARNTAIQASQADLLVFLGADILLRPHVLMHHLTFHTQHPNIHIGALGMVKWDPSSRPSPLMEWMIHGGPQNDFDSLLGSSWADPAHYFYGSHLSLKRSLVHTYPFPTIYNQYGWEDLDLGCQLKHAGLKLAVLHQAIGLHHHAYTADMVLRRQQAVGRGISMFVKRHPTEARRPTLSRGGQQKLVLYQLPGVRKIAQGVMRVFASRRSLPRVYSAITAAEFWANSGKMYDK